MAGKHGRHSVDQPQTTLKGNRQDSREPFFLKPKYHFSSELNQELSLSIFFCLFWHKQH